MVSRNLQMQEEILIFQSFNIAYLSKEISCEGGQGFENVKINQN